MKKLAKDFEKEQIDQIMVSAVQVQTFKQQFKDIANTIKLFSTIEQQFIKKFRLKNQQNFSQTQFSEFVKAFKQTLKYYESYHQYIQGTLQKYAFCNKLRKFNKQLCKSQGKIVNFFTTQIQFHSAFIRQKQTQFTNAIENLKNVCVRCKDIQNKKNIQNTKQQLHFPFKNAYKMYKDLSCTDCQYDKLDENQLDFKQKDSDLHGYDISTAQLRLKKIIQKNKKSQISALSQIIDMFQKKQQAQFNTVNKSKINEMFYQLQNQLQNRSLQIEQYLQDLSIFNEKLMSYNPHITSTCQPYQQIEPNIVQKQLKFNLHKIIKKIYAKINQIIQKRKDQSVSKHVQVNFTQDHVIKQLQRQKKKLISDLRQSQQEKQYTINVLKAQIQRITQQLTLVSDDKVKIQIIKNEYFYEKQGLSKQNYQLTKIIQKLRKQMEKIEKNSGKQKKIDKNKQQQQQQDQEQQIKKQSTLLDQKKIKQAQNALIYEFQQRQQQLLKKLQTKNKRGKKGFFAPRRSKIIQVTNLQQLNIGGLQKTVSRFSKDINLEEMNAQTFQIEKQQKSLFFEEANQANQTPQSCQSVAQQFNNYDKLQQKNSNFLSLHQNQSNFISNKLKAKTSTKIDKIQNQSSQIKSNKSISQTSEDVRKQLQELQQLKKFKLMESKIGNMYNKNKQIKNNLTEIQSKQFQTIENNKIIDQQVSGQQKNVNKNKQTTKKQVPSIQSITSSNYLQAYNEYLKENQLQVTRGVQTEQLSFVIYRILYDHQISKNNFNQNILTFNAFKFGYDQFLNQITNLIQKQQKNPIRKLNMYKGSSFILKKSHNYRFNKKQFLNTFHSNEQQNEKQEKHYFIPKHKNQSFKQNIMSKTTNNYSFYKQYRETAQKTLLNFRNTNQNLNLNPLACKTISDFKNISLDKKRKPINENKELILNINKIKTESHDESRKIDLKQKDQKVKRIEQTEKFIKNKCLNDFITTQDIQSLFLTFQTAKQIQEKKKNKVEIKNLNNVEIRFTTEILAVIANIHVLSLQHYEYIKNLLTSPSKFFQKNQFEISKQSQWDADLNQNIHYLVFLHRNCSAKNKLKYLVNQKIRKQSNSGKFQKSFSICNHLRMFLTKISDLIQYLNQNDEQRSYFECEDKQKITSIQNMTPKINNDHFLL